jgi:hypothetical protein
MAHATINLIGWGYAESGDVLNKEAPAFEGAMRRRGFSRVSVPINGRRN